MLKIRVSLSKDEDEKVILHGKKTDERTKRKMRKIKRRRMDNFGMKEEEGR